MGCDRSALAALEWHKRWIELAADTDEYIERNREWLSDPVTALGKFLVQDLQEYLSHPDPTIAKPNMAVPRNSIPTAR